MNASQSRNSPNNQFDRAAPRLSTLNSQPSTRAFSILYPLSSILVFLSLSAYAHDPLANLPEPVSIPEAWDVLTQSVANIDKCIDTNQLGTISTHVGNCSPALRLLQSDAKKKGDPALVAQLETLFAAGDAVIIATRQRENPAAKARDAYANYSAAIFQLARAYTPAQVKGGVFVCVHHPLERSPDPAAPCPKCGMKLVRRRIPSSLTYERAGEPSMTLSVRTDAPLKVGQKVTVTLQLTRVKDNAPVTHKDLLLMHTEKIHLLIIDRSLADYHHEHPKPTDAPGQYIFSFTPAKPGPYRIFADVVPAESFVQEYVVADIPSDTPPEKIDPGKPDRKVEADGFYYSLKFDSPGGAVKANQIMVGTLSVSGPDGRPYNQLRPVMGAFAHLVAFNEDGKTVLHVHPEGAEPDSPDRRGGPNLTFRFYAPVPGFYRLYAQTQAFDDSIFAPFNVTVEK